ncbi:hypothetical protein [Allobranchiibius sp. GilTou38]|uniref:hypothetical protein n=1 Tax=Allobranchiibius sp. GilTou38 TaxID=2815210 RepID=UPI001AA1A6A6|nr:hypothetical protein [Allobranchiibius sp. GilTou38]MBO1768515.1 hypothetical protein [Allobranchiibius sp. GilTou38]
MNSYMMQRAWIHASSFEEELIRLSSDPGYVCGWGDTRPVLTPPALRRSHQVMQRRVPVEVLIGDKIGCEARIKAAPQLGGWGRAGKSVIAYLEVVSYAEQTRQDAVRAFEGILLDPIRAESNSLPDGRKQQLRCQQDTLAARHGP